MEVQDTTPKIKVNRFMKYHFQISETYLNKQKPFVRNIKWCDTKLRILSNLCDFIFMFWPTIIFTFIVLALVSPLNMGDEFLYDSSFLVNCYCVSMLIFNSFSAVYFHGQSIGKRYYGLKVVKNNNSECSLFLSFLREFLGKSIPFAVLFYFFRLYGFIGFCIFDVAMLCIDPKHRSIIDFLLGTKIVVLPVSESCVEMTVKSEHETTSEEEPIKAINSNKNADITEEEVSVETPEEALNEMMEDIHEIPLSNEIKEDKEVVAVNEDENNTSLDKIETKAKEEPVEEHMEEVSDAPLEEDNLKTIDDTLKEETIKENDEDLVLNQDEKESDDQGNQKDSQEIIKDNADNVKTDQVEEKTKDESKTTKKEDSVGVTHNKKKNTSKKKKKKHRK